MIGGEQQKVLVNIGDDGILRLDENFSELLGLNEREFNWKLVREHDGKTKQSNAIGWIEWDETARFIWAIVMIFIFVSLNEITS